MRSLFCVLAKLMGLSLLCWGIILLPQLGLWIHGAMHQPPPEGGEPLCNQTFAPWGWLSLSMVSFALSLTLGLLLLAKTELVADMLRVSDETMPSFAPVRSFLRVGVILIGLNVLASKGVPELVEAAIRVARLPSALFASGYVGTAVISAALSTGLGIIFVFWSDGVVSLIWGRAGKGDITDL